MLVNLLMPYWGKKTSRSSKKKSLGELIRFWKKSKKHTMTSKKYDLRGAEGGEDDQDSVLCQINRNIGRLMEEVTSMKAEFKSLKAESKNTKKELNRKFDDFQEELTNKIDELKAVTEANAKDIAENKERITEVTKEVVDLGARTRTSEEKIELLEVQIRNKNLVLRGVSEKFGQSNLREEFETECQKYMETKYLIDIENFF